MANSARARLLERALALPTARPSDFTAGRQPPTDAHPENVKIINDSALRARLIGANIAEGLQSPKGPQRIASILRVYPDFDAPGRENHSSAPNRASATRRKDGASGSRPSVEDMEALLTRVRALEGHVAREMNMAVDADIERLRKRLAEARAEDIEAAHNELGAALERRRSMTSEIRREAFRRIERDSGFGPRIYVSLLRE